MGTVTVSTSGMVIEAPSHTASRSGRSTSQDASDACPTSWADSWISASRSRPSPGSVSRPIARAHITSGVNSATSPATTAITHASALRHSRTVRSVRR